MKRVAIIGAGCSGLAAIKCCLEEGLVPVCFERETQLGGLWRYHETTVSGRGSVYKSCVINTSKEMMAFSDFPVPEDFPPFMPHDLVLEYFQMYADNFSLNKHIAFNRSVVLISKSHDYDVTGKWVVRHRRYVADCGKYDTREETFDGVMLCSGHLTVPREVKFDGLGLFRGIKMHSHAYKTPLDLVEKSVLIIGVGNSGSDIAVDVSHLSSQVFLSTRHGSWVFSRMGFWGLPLDAIANSRVAFVCNYRVLQWCVEKMANFRFDHEAYGLKPAHRGLEAHPTINDELPIRIMTGAVKVKSNVSRFTEDGAFFDDGSFERLDAVIFATGYSYKYDYMSSDVFDTDRNEVTLYKYTFPPHLAHPTLSVIGLVQAVGAVMPISELQSRWFARVMKGLVQLPTHDEMMRDVNEKKVRMNRQFIPSERHTLETMWVPFMDELADQIGARPDLWRIARQDIRLAARCLFGPCVPAQYRLTGPHPWNRARSTINAAFSRCLKGLKTRVLVQNHPTTVGRKLLTDPRSRLYNNMYVFRVLFMVGVLVLLVCFIVT